MCDGRAAALTLVLGLTLAAPARAEPAVSVVSLPFRVTEMRGPDSEAALAAETSGLLPRARTGGVAVVWGEEGGAVLSLGESGVTVTPMPAEAAQGLATAETPRGAAPGSRRALAGPVSAYFSEPRSGPDGHPAAGAVTVRERQPVARSADPKPVPVATATVPAGADAVFTGGAVQAVDLDGRLHLLAAKAVGNRIGLAVIGRQGEAWSIAAETPAETGRLGPAAAGNFDGSGHATLALVRNAAEGRLQHWRVAPGTATLLGEAPGYAESAAVADIDGDGVPEVAVPTRDRTALALVSLRGGISERARVTLPAPARSGPVVLGSGRSLHVLVPLEDGRVADLRP
ncbi:FG-GAP repeat domain-containing protein [Methylobacterium sp. ID0610]|uniref:FG-GAP repeat domain-containing protein n=1 Tax=Methylobacterium carpenticola TaxID=3344827 RepID=UPI00368FBD2D